MWGLPLPNRPAAPPPQAKPDKQVPPQTSGKIRDMRPALIDPQAATVQAWHREPLTQGDTSASRASPCDASVSEEPDLLQGVQQLTVQFSGGSATSPCSPETSTNQFTPTVSQFFSTWKVDYHYNSTLHRAVTTFKREKYV